MLRLENIVKTYVTGELRQTALKGVSISFREHEFVSILGQSGSGKTTLLNIIGGLDRYDSGDLVIDGVSTKDYKDADWDYYRNHSIGFVFQSYNLIPHQTVLANVEMALTLAGVSKKERRQRAVEVLEKVAWGPAPQAPQPDVRGQMQRVAIARALINHPTILLADEPTGALDSETSLQIMDLLQEIAKDTLVVMVTHNQELAERYSTRIVRLRDGAIIGDTDPYTDQEAQRPPEKHKKISMSFATALSLSFQNLGTKKGRTLLTAFAGSIGIIGIALILGLSTGMNDYIDDIQKETMTSYPITISAETLDLSAAMGAQGERMGQAQEEDTSQDRTGVYADYREMETQEMISSNIVENNLTDFKKYLDDPNSDIRQYLGENGVVYNYNVAFSVYSRDADGTLVSSDSTLEDSDTMQTGQSPMESTLQSSITGENPAAAENFSQLMAGADGSLVSHVVTDSYDVLYGSWPQAYDEVVLVLDENNSIPVQTLYQLGLITADQYCQAEDEIAEDGQASELRLDYADVLDHTFSLVAACDHYLENQDGTFTYLEDGAVNQDQLLENAMDLKIVGVIRPKADADNADITTAVAYTAALSDYLIQHTDESAVVRAQEADPDTNVLTGIAFTVPDDAGKAQAAKDYLSGLGISEKASFYQMLVYYASSEGSSSSAAMGTMVLDEASQAGTMVLDEASQAAALDQYLAGNPDQELLLQVYDQYVAGSTYEDNMTNFGKVSYDAPSSISIYADSFEDKDAIAACIEAYNADKDEDQQITYTDYVAMLTSSITTIINGISYVLIAFVSISLVVSCIMIGIITHISVLERTKEIGILRALGASKRNISQVFNAETFIIGCCAGLLGIVVSLIALVPITSLIQNLSGIADLQAKLPLGYSLLLIAISIAITMVGGLIPARKAAKKDPVIALRTE